ncbi:MAG: TetR/AcrR family transcriptional regulator [Lachnospiraceae bacterium]|nr:TetR/AcrR family transcriptional regulator [Lachnospiraceae bacterium]
MPNITKYNAILDALLKLLETKKIQTISVSEIAQTAGIGKGSIYYYFSSKNAILEALIERNYQNTLETAKKLTTQENVSPFTRMAMIFQACRSSSLDAFADKSDLTQTSAYEDSVLHQKYLTYLITELKPVLTTIIQQGIEQGQIHFDYPEALAEIVLIVLAVKFDNTILPSSPDEIEAILQGLVSLLEKGTDNPKGSLNFLLTGYDWNGTDSQ